jgi:hypothetical protein
LKGIVRYCGIALHKRDSSLVAGTQPKEVARVRDHFLRGKLALTASDQALDDAIQDVLGTTMKAEHSKSRVTVYYLLAERFGKLGTFEKSA